MSKVDDIQPAGPLSQAAVASFVFGVIQTSLTVAYYLIVMTISSGLSNAGFALPQSLPGRTETTESAILLTCLVNVWGFLGLMTGLIGLVSLKDGKSGGWLATWGTLMGFTCLLVGFWPLLWG
jgi:hypothetical protein